MLAVSLVAWAGTIFFPSLNLGLLICRVKHWDEIGLLLLLLFFKVFIYLFGCIRSQLWCTGSLVKVYKLRYPVADGILVPQPGIEPKPPTLEWGFLATGPPGKSLG